VAEEQLQRRQRRRVRGVAVLPDGGWAVRDSKNPGGPKLAFAADEWRAFTAGVKAGEFDLA
jgi:hypothetical protein